MPTFTVIWADDSTSTVEFNSVKFERIEGRWWWFFKFGKEIVAVRFPFDIYDALPKSTNERYELLVGAMTEWAKKHELKHATNDLTLTAFLEDGGQLRVD